MVCQPVPVGQSLAVVSNFSVLAVLAGVGSLGIPCQEVIVLAPLANLCAPLPSGWQHRDVASNGRIKQDPLTIYGGPIQMASTWGRGN